LLVLRRRKRKVIEEVEENRSGGPERLQLKEYYAQETVSAELDGIEVPVEAGDERANRHELETSSR
jgi:hypothetical protein